MFQGKYYEQVQGAAIGSPISPNVPNIFIEDYETKVINTSTNCQDYAEVMWMTHLSSRRQNTWTSFWIISTPLTLASSLQQKTPDLLDEMCFALVELTLIGLKHPLVTSHSQVMRLDKLPQHASVDMLSKHAVAQS